MSSERVTGQISTQGSSGKRRLSRLAAYLKVTAAIVALLGNNAAFAQQLPTGGTVAAGSATIGAPQNGTLNINQSSSQAIINWNAFSVGRGGTVNFNQPNSSSATLNRVTGSTPSWIAGTINAPGTVLLVNPNGIAITKSGVINTGSFAASTLDISNADFMAGKYRFTGNGGSAAVRNSGRINVSDGGFAALLGGQIANNGVISARLGKVGLGAGELITLDLAGDGFLSVAVPSSQMGKLVDASGALVSNKGKIRADGGSVFLTAATASTILRDAVNVPGSIRANTVGTHNGRIVIGGGDGGRVTVTGKLAASGNSKRNGGKIEVSGANVALNGKVSANGKNGGNITVASSGDLSVSGKVEAKGNDGLGGRIDLTGANIKVIGALIDASGTTGGGLVRIGGTFQGGHGDPNDPLYQSFIGRFGDLPAIASAQTVTIDAGTTINISAKTTGDAGTAVIWSDQLTSFAGTVTGIGGASGGNGGFAEVSGKQLLDFTGKVDLLAASGAIGTLLLDPYNVTIVPGTGGVFTATANSNLGADTLTAALAGANVTVSAGTGGAGTGNITLRNDVALSWNSATTLTLDASSNVAGSITLNGSITANAGGLNLKAGTDSGVITATGAVSVNIFTLTSGYWTQNAASMPGGVLPAFSANDFRFGNFKATGGYFLRVAGGDGSVATPYQIADIYGLQGLRSEATGGPSIGQLTHAFVLINDINAGGTANWNSGAGFAPIGSNTNTYSFTGSFDGQGHTISGLTINLPTTDYVGLFGLIQFDSGSSILSASIKNLNLTGANITGQDYTGAIIGNANTTVAYSGLSASGTVAGRDRTGGLIGQIDGGTVSSSSFGGAVAGRSYVGGLVGLTSGSIQQSFSSAAVTASGVAAGTYAGGLIGFFSGTTVVDSYATGSVTSTSSLGTQKGAGGLVGYMSGGSILTSYATGNIAGYINVGGLVGYFSAGSISQSYATTGTVTASSTGPVGGLVGYSFGSISQSYATGAVSGINGAFAGGLVGETGLNSTIADSYALGSVTTATGSGSGAVGGLVGWVDVNTASITRSYSAGAVSGGASQSVGGLIGVNKITAGNAATRITSNYFDYQAAGVSSTSGVGSLNGSIVAGSVTGKTTTELQSALPNGFSTSTWASIAGNYPLLLSQPGFVVGTVYDTYGGSTVSNVTVSILINGTVSTAQTDGSGAYMVYLGSSGIAAGTNVVVYTSGGGVSFVHTSGKSASGLNLYAGYVSETSSNATSSGIATELASALAGNSTLLSQVSGLSNYVVNATAGTFNIDGAIGSGTLGTLVLLSSGTVTQSAAISATNLLLQGTGAIYVLGNSGNNVATLAGSVGSGSIAYNNGANNLSVGTVGGINGVTAATLDLTATGTVSQTQAIKASAGGLALVLQGTGGIYNLTNASNSVATFAANTGSVNLTDSVALALNTVGSVSNVTTTAGLTLTTNSLTLNGSTGLISAAGQTVTIKPLGTTTTMGLGTGTGTLTLNTAALGRITAGTLVFGSAANTGTLTVGGTVSLTNLSTITNLSLISGGTVTVASGGSLTDSRTTSTLTLQGATLTLTGTVSSTGASGVLVLNTTGTATATGAITATGLGLNLLGSGGTFNLTSTSNNITTLSASIGAGSINLVDNRVLSIGTVNGTAGISAGTAQISNTNTTTQTAAITATNLVLLGAGGTYTLTNASNAITNLGTVTLGSGSLNLVDTGGLTVTGVVGASGGVTLNTSGALAINNTVNAGAGNVSLTATGAGNAITQSLGGAITANTLALSTDNGNATLDTATNAVSALGNVSIGAGVLALKTATAGGLAVPGASITANGGIAVTNTTGGITTTGVVQASNGAVALTAAAGNIVTGGSLIANGGSTTLTATNGSITLGGSLTGTGVSLTSATSLTLNQNIFANSGNVLLNATGANSNITQTAGRVQGAGLLATALNGSVNLTAGAANNSVATIAGRSNGNFTYTAAQSTAFTIGTVSGTSGIVSSNGSVAVTLTNSATPVTVGQAITASNGGVTLSSGGNLTVNAAVTANTGTGTISLASTTGAINQNSSGVLTGNALTLSTNGGNATLNIATNVITNLGATTLGTGALSLLDTGGLTVTGAVGATGGITINTSGLLGGGGSLNAGAGNVSLTVTGASGGILFGGAITANTLTLSSDNGWATVNGSANAITNLGTVTLGTGLLNLVNAGDLTVTGAVGATGGISISTAGALVINAALNGGTNLVQLQTTGAGNAISQSASGIITGDLYLTTSGGNATLDTATNAVSGGVNASLGAGALALKTAKAGSLSVSSSFVTANGGIAVTNTTGGIATSGSLAASNGAVALTATAAGAGITLGGTITGVGVTLNSNAALAINQAINGGTGTVSLNVTGASNGITQSVAITADTLTLSTNDGNATLNSATNAITNLGTTTLGAGSLNLRDTGGLAVTGAVGATGGITLNTSGALAINGNLNAGTGNVSLTTTGAGNAISQNALGIITANTLSLATDNGDVDLRPAGGSHAIANLGTVTLGSGRLILPTAGSLTVTGAVDATGGINLFADHGFINIRAALNAGSTGDVALTGPSGISQTSTGIITAKTLFLNAVVNGADLSATNNVTNLGNVQLQGGSLTLVDAGGLTITGNVFANGITVKTTGGDLTIGIGGAVTSGANGVVLSTDANFINNRGAGAVGTFGRWLVYSAAPAGDTFGGLDSGNAAIWNATYATLAPGSVAATGNRYIFAAQPTLTITSTGTVTKTYGDDATAPVAGSSFAVSGLQGVASAFTDTASDVYSGAPALTSTGSAATADAGNYNINGAAGSLAALNGYAFAFVNNGTLTVNKATLTATANAASRDYGDANPTLSGSITGFKNGQTAATFGGDTWTTLADLTSNVGNYGLTGGLANTASNYTIAQAAANGTALTVNKATLTFTANTASRNVGDANPTLSGSITGFKNGQTATTFGGDIWSTLADQTSPAGSYAVAGNLTNAAPNYRFVQAAGNLTALTVKAAPPTGTNGGTDSKTNGADGNNPSQFNSRPDPNGAPKGVNISFQLQGAGPISVSFTPPAPPVRLSTTPSTDVAPAALPSGQNLATNNGLTYPPISQLDPNQYSSFKAADWAAEAGEAAIFVMIARGADQGHAADAMIDGFWNGTSASWTPQQSFAGKVTFSDGAGNTVTPTGNAGFPIAAGTTDFGLLLKSGPVMISNGATPAHWLLATQLTPDGKGIVANDPASGKQVVLSYDAASKTVGGVTSVFDASSNKFVPFVEASTGTPALAGLQGFSPANFLAVSTK